MYACKAYADNIINMIRGTSFTYGSGKKYLALFTKNLTRLGTNGTEASFAGYSRQEISFARDTEDVGRIYNNKPITFSNSGSAQTIRYIGVYTGSQPGDFSDPILWGPLASPLVLDGDVRFDKDSISWQMTGFFGDELRKKVTDPIIGSSSSGALRTLYVALYDNNPKSGGVEIEKTIDGTTSGYSRVALTTSDFAEPQDDSDGYSYTSLQSTITITTEANVGWGNVRYIGLMSAASSGYLYASFELQQNITVGSGDSVRIPVGSLELHVG